MTNIHPTNNAVSAFFGFMLALIGVGYLIYFIHYVATSIQANEIILTVSQETLKGIDRLFRMEVEEQNPVHLPTEYSIQILSNKAGYIQNINYSGLFDLCKKHDNVIEIPKNVGDFIAHGELLCRVEKEKGCLEEDIRRNISIGSYRNAEDDIAFGVLQLVDIALKGLSPGLNDPTTANTAIDYLGDIFLHLANRPLGKSVYADGENARVIAARYTFEALLESAFPPIIENGKGQSIVLKRLSDTLVKIFEVIEAPDYKEQIEHYLSAINVHLSKPEFV